MSRPQNGRCDTGAFEFAGPPPPADEEPPDTQYISGPVQDSLETNAFFFTGTDNITPTDELIYECRLIEHDLTEAPEPQSPFEAIDPMFICQSCSSGWQTELLEDGLYTFEVRAIDRAGREDPTPAVHTFNGLDINPPDTIIAEKPPLVTNSRAATFTFSGVDNGTPAPFLEYECRLDSRDPEMWLECFNPTFYSNLTSGQHTLEVRAIDGAEVYDPTPARYTWTVGVGTAPDGTSNCDTANVTLTPTADGWIDEVNPVENYLFDQELEVRSDADRQPGGRAARARGRPERPHADSLPGAERRAGLRARVRHAAAVRRRHDRGPHAPGDPAGRAVPREHAHLDEPARHAGRRSRRDQRRRGLPRVGREGPRRGDARVRRQPRLADPRRARERPGERRRPELREPRDAAGSARDQRCRS